MTWPRAIAGTANRAVTRATLTQGFKMCSFRWLSRASVLEVSRLRALGTSLIRAIFRTFLGELRRILLLRLTKKG